MAIPKDPTSLVRYGDLRDEVERAVARRLPQAIAQAVSGVISTDGSGEVIGVAGEQLSQNDVLRVTGVSTVDGVKYRSVSKALATDSAAIDGVLYVAGTSINGDTTPDLGSRLVAFYEAVVYNLSGSPVVGAKIYVSDTGGLSLTAGTIPRVVGEVIRSSSGTYDVLFDGIGSSPLDYLDVRDFGAVSDFNGTTGTDNRAVFQTVADLARTRKRRMYVPAGGEFLVVCGAANELIFGTGVAGETVEVFGDGAGVSKVRIGQDGGGAVMSVVENFTGIICRAGSFVTFRDMTIQGCTTPGGMFYQAGILHEDGGLEGRLTLLGIDTLWFATAVKAEGNVLLEIDGGSNIKGHSVTVLQVKNTTNGGRFHTGRATFERVDNGFFDRQHVLYIDENISYRLGYATTVLGCPNGTASSFALHNFGGAPENALYCDVAATFLGQADCQILTNSRVLTRISSPVIELKKNACRGVWVRNGGAFVDSTRFVASVSALQAAYGIDAYIGVSIARLFAINPRFEGTFGTGVCVYRSTTQTRIYAWHLINPVFVHTSGWPLAIFGGVTDQLTIIDSAKFHGGHAEENIYCLGGEVRVLDGYATNGRIAYFSPTDANIKIIWSRNTGVPLNINNGTANTVEVFGDDSGDGAFAVTGAGTVVGHLEPTAGTYLSAVTAAATITLAHGYRRFTISGTTQISTVEFGDAGHKTSEAEIELFLSGACSFGTSGNVTPRHTAARTVGETVRLRWDPYTSKWVEQFSPLATGSPTAGQVLYAAAAGERAAAEAALFYDASTDRLDVGSGATIVSVGGGASKVVMGGATVGEFGGGQDLWLQAVGDLVCRPGLSTRWLVLSASPYQIVPAANDTSDIGESSTPRKVRDIWLSRDAQVGRFVVLTTQTPTAAGQIGMNTTSGRPKAYIDGASHELAHVDEVEQALKAFKSANESVTSSTALQDDDHLSVTLAANTTYEFEFILFITNAGATEGIKLAVGGTAGVSNLKAQISIYDDNLNSLAAFARVTAFDSAVGAGLGANDSFAEIRGSITTTGSGGTFKLRWAQNTSGGNASTVQANSSLEVKKLA